MSVLFETEKYASENSEVTTSNPLGDFIQAAIKKAQSSKGLMREDIVEDISQLLACHPTDLAFMFGQNNMNPQDRSIDLPDYRLALSDVYLEAAE